MSSRFIVAFENLSCQMSTEWGHQNKRKLIEQNLIIIFIENQSQSKGIAQQVNSSMKNQSTQF